MTLPKISFVIILLIPGLAQAQAGQCFDSAILGVDSGGTRLSLTTGWLMDVYPGQAPAVEFWEPQEKLRVCELGGAAYRITDLPRKDHIDALRQFPG
jgi:hypothetical protein